jgi:putative transposase
MAHAKGRVSLTEEQRASLERLVRAHKTPQEVARRARIVLMSAEGMRNIDQARVLGIDPQRVRRWRRRWAERQAAVVAGEGQEVDDLVWATLQDEDRPGVKPTFTAEQVAQIIAVACEKPSDCGRPVSHWTPRELAAEVIKRGIVKTISPRHIARFFEGCRAEAAQVAVLAQREDQGHRPRGVRPRFRRSVRHVPKGP